MKQYLFRSIGIGAAVAAFGAVPATALAQNAASTTTACANPLLTQPFLAWGDSHWYALAPGETADGAHVEEVSSAFYGSLADIPANSKSFGKVPGVAQQD